MRKYHSTLGRMKWGSKMVDLVVMSIPQMKPHGQKADGTGEKISVPFQVEGRTGGSGGSIKFHRQVYCRATKEGNTFYFLLNRVKVEVPKLF